MTTATITDLELLGPGYRVPSAAGCPSTSDASAGTPGGSPYISGTGCGHCWPAPSRTRPSTPDGSAASTRTGSSSPTWPGCR